MNILSELLALMEKVPGTFWGVVIGSFFTLIGITLTNRANDRRAQAQLSHERDLQRLERELSLRKEVYLAAAEAISTGIIAIGRFASMNVPDNILTADYIEKSPSITKVYVIAGKETAKTIGDFVSELIGSYLYLAEKRFLLSLLENELTSIQQNMERFSKEQDVMRELMKNIDLNTSLGVSIFETVERNYESNKVEMSETLKKRDKLSANFYMEQGKLLIECQTEAARLNQLVVPILVAMREELELRVSEHVLVQVFEQTSQKIHEYLRTRLDNIPQLVNSTLSEMTKETKEGKSERQN